MCLNVFSFQSFIGLWHVCNFFNVLYDLGLLLFVKDWYCIVVRLVWMADLVLCDDHCLVVASSPS